ncbi:MAG TPA: hypothetical protein VGL56_15295 [Fimbriimonadaceae bacterium]|jgi:hypothetical protein
MLVKIRVLVGLLFGVLAASCVARPHDVSGRSANLGQNSSFIQNKGQWDTRVKFLAQSNNANLWVTRDGMVVDLHKFEPEKQAKTRFKQNHVASKGMLTGDVVRLTLKGASTPAFKGLIKQPGSYNYFIGKDRSKWVKNVARYSEAEAQKAYPGVSVRYYFEDGMPRYDFVCSPGSDPSKIAFDIQGATHLKLINGSDLRVITPLGNLDMKDLVAYQGQGASRCTVPCKIVLKGNRVGFVAGRYDRSKPLVIDPLIFCTYLGGSGNFGFSGEAVTALSVDSAGNPVVAGFTDSTDFPISAGAYQIQDIAQQGTAFVAKLNANGQTLMFGTFLGGSFMDLAETLALDSSDNPVVGGYTASADFPTTVGAYSTTHASQNETGFVSKLSADGQTLLFSTYLGGSNNEGVFALALDSSQDPVVAGYTTSTDFPTTAGAYQTTSPNGNGAGFIAKLDPTGQTLTFSTYLGGNIQDEIRGLALDSSGNPVAVGITYSTTFPVSVGAFQTINSSREGTGFVTKLSSDGSILLSGTYLGGNEFDGAFSLALDSTGNIVVGGSTGSTNFPVTPGSYQLKMNAAPGNSNGFVAKLSADETTLLFGTYLGGSGAPSDYGDLVLSVKLDSSGNAVLAGTTDSSDFPITSNAIQGQYNTPFFTGFLAMLSADGSTILYSSYLGGSDADTADSVALTTPGKVFIAGQAFSADFPVTPLAFQTTNYNASGTGFVAAASIAPATQAALSGFRLTSPSIAGGITEKAAVYLNALALSNGKTVSLSSNSALATLPTSVVVPAGTNAVNFPVVTGGVSANTSVTLTALSGGKTLAITLQLTPAPLAALTLNPGAVIGGATTQATVSLGGLAGSGGTAITLSSSDPNATVQPSVTVSSGSPNATFPITTAAVSTTVQATITASLNGVTKTYTLPVESAALVQLRLTAPTLLGGNGMNVAVYLNGPAGPGGSIVNISCNNSNVTVPASVVVPAGANAFAFPISSVAVSSNAVVTLSATKGPVTIQQTLTLTAATVSQVASAPSAVIGGIGAQVTVTLNGAAGPSGATVTLASSDSNVVVPASVPVLAGASFASFSVATGPVASTLVVNITATLNGASKSGTLIVETAGILVLRLGSFTLKGGTGMNVAVYLNGLAGAGGAKISIASNNPNVTVPATVTVPFGQTVVSFPISSSAVASNTSVTISATKGVVTLTQSLTLTP